VRGDAPGSNAARAGAQDAAEAHERQRDMPEALVGGLDEIDAIPQPGDAPAVGELGLSSAGGPTIHEPAARQGQAGKTSDTTCAACGRTLAPSAVICVACGFDRRTGRRVDAELP
jgi:ribosomal protein L37E